MKIAVIGTGIAGNAAAWALSDRHELVVYEKDRRAGGHSHTITVDYDGTPIAVDTGFIVYNELNYPGLTDLFAELGVATKPTTMGFTLSADRGRFEWSGGGDNWIATARGLLAQPSNALSPSYLRMLAAILRFNAQGIRDDDAGAIGDESLGDWLARHRFPSRLVRDCIAPMGAAIWTTPADTILDFPAREFIGFFNRHRLLHYDRPVWRSVVGGSRAYVERMTASYRRTLRLGSAAVAVERQPGGGVIVRDSAGHAERFDHVVIAAHSDQALAMLAEPRAQEHAVLSAIPYRGNTGYLHRDRRLMPKRRRAWSAWNYLRWDGCGEAGGPMATTYWMNALQGIDERFPLFVSLNPPFEPDPESVFARFECEHPLYSRAAFAAQKRLPEIQGTGGVWFAGAWTGYGFHEDGLQSGLSVARRIDATVWTDQVPAFAEAAE